MKAILYCRVDGPENPFTGDALRVQQSRLIAYAEKNGMEIAGVYMDAGFSGQTLDRPGLKAVVQAVKDGSADTILVVNRDRLFRGHMPEELRGLSICAVKERETGLER